MTLLEQLYNNFSIFPAKADKSPAVKSWIPYRTEKIDFSKLKGHKYFAIVCGFENLEVIDIDNHFKDADKLLKEIYNDFDFSEFPILKTGGGGYHIYYKCEKIEGNQKLAQRLNDKGRPETLIETRGIGGYVIGLPSPGYEVIQGDLDKLPLITAEQRSDILGVCRALNEVEAKKEIKADIKHEIQGISPGDRYIEDPTSPAETIKLLLNHGWTTPNDKNFRRPEKKEGFSATFGKVGINKFYVFSTNASPFEAQMSYSMFGVRATLLHGGNYSNCAKELAEKYGIKITAKATKKKKEDENPELPKKWRALLAIIKDWNLRFRFNELTKVAECSRDEKKYDTIGMLIGDIVYEMETKRGIASISGAKIDEMIKNTTICKTYNPIKNFFNNLPKWDGKDHFKQMCNYITLDKEEDPIFFESMLKKHYIRAIRCALTDYTNRMVFTLHGPQEIGKSMFFEWSVPNEIYNEENIDPTDKDSILSLSRYLILNMDDIDSLNKKEVYKLKAFISKGSVTKRVSYGRNDEKFDRVASFVASTNKSDILVDSSNTRWIILKVKNFDWRGYTKEVSPLQLWAQADVLLKENKESGELSSIEKQERERRNNVFFLETSTERELLIKYFEEGDIPLTATDILIILQNKNYGVKLNSYQLCRELKRIYGEPENKRVDGKSGRYYNLTPPSEIKEEYNNHYETAEKIENAPF